jgi:initiation factor 1A
MYSIHKYIKTRNNWFIHTNMPRNTRGGNKAKRGKNTRNDDEDKKTPLAEGGQVYARVEKRLGNNRIEVECSDNKKRSAVIRGKFIKRVWMNPGDILLVDTDGMGQEGVCVINHKYDRKEIRELRQKGLISFEDSGGDLKFDDETDGIIVEPVKKQPESDNWMDEMMPPSDSDDEEYTSARNVFINEKKSKEDEKKQKGKKRMSKFSDYASGSSSSSSDQVDLDDL